MPLFNGAPDGSPAVRVTTMDGTGKVAAGPDVATEVTTEVLGADDGEDAEPHPVRATPESAAAPTMEDTPLSLRICLP